MLLADCVKVLADSGTVLADSVMVLSRCFPPHVPQLMLITPAGKVARSLVSWSRRACFSISLPFAAASRLCRLFLLVGGITVRSLARFLDHKTTFSLRIDNRAVPEKNWRYAHAQ